MRAGARPRRSRLVTMKAILNEHGEPIRCYCCGVMFSRATFHWSSRGPRCSQCIAITERIGDSFRASGERTVVYFGRETFGDRRYEITED